MRHGATALVLCAALATTASARADCLDLPPEGAARTILSLDVVDADVPREPPLISFDSDGGIEVRRGDTVLRDTMPREQLSEMLESFIREYRLPSIDGDAIRTAFNERQRFPVADAPTSFLQLDLPGCRHAVRVFASAFLAGRGHGIDALERFRAIEVRLLEIVGSIQARP